MEIKKVKLISFSPTGTTQKVLETIASWLNENCSTRKEPQVFGLDG